MPPSGCFNIVENTEPERGGKIRLTDGLSSLATPEGEDAGVYGDIFEACATTQVTNFGT